MELKRQEIAALLGVSSRTISDFVKKGMPQTGVASGTRYPATECVAWYVQYQIDIALQGTTSAALLGDVPPVEVSEAILKHWQAERERLRTLAVSEKLVSVEDSERQMNFRLTQIRNALDAIPFSWSPFLVGITDTDELQQQLGHQLDRFYSGLSSLPDRDELEDNDPTPMTPNDEDD